MKLIEVDWLDSSGMNGWTHDKSEQNLRCKSIGYVLGETKQGITIASHFSFNGSVNSPMTIPKVAITKIRVIRYCKDMWK